MSGLASASRLGISAFDETQRVELRPNRSEENVQAVISAVYRQLLGNDYVMASERLTYAESQLRQGTTTVREFVRTVAKSELYKTRFFYPNSNNRFTELNYKHLLGRAPYDEAELIFHFGLYNEKGYDADIDAFIDSEEYVTNFGDNVVPFYRGFGYFTGARTVGFNRMFRLYRGYANSDSSQVEGKSPRLTRNLAQNSSNTIVGPSGGATGWSYRASSDSAPRNRPNTGAGTADDLNRLYRLEVTSIRTPGYPAVRRSSTVFMVPHHQLLAKMQQIHRTGGKIASITPV
ncbi:phycobilisome linker polypeptide [Leptolyngbya sp. FACHB-261]|uniref:phycobilisome linker polypeptide n=1 Tax=Leptolyngbya sp. FACHB-261 TaxID=2692806 RepID=UPI0016824BA0|nr:phycobilisome linker polypeptide [Leptolyngbya sp. FACHB-261]MBD2104507.1 phycobilisome linker polypeptide [Leptolyngbya sp. FACHB-261]